LPAQAGLSKKGRDTPTTPSLRATPPQAPLKRGFNTYRHVFQQEGMISVIFVIMFVYMNSSTALRTSFLRRLVYIFLFSAAFAFVESSVVVYLRDLYYPQGFHFPIKIIVDRNLVIEVIREFATIVMMISVAALAPLYSSPQRVESSTEGGRLLPVKKFWERFGYFLIIFGVWDIFFYVWLKASLGWPESLFTWDILFLIPVPWIAPVLAPVIISMVMILIGIDITRLFDKGYNVKPRLIHWLMVIAGSAIILYSFMSDMDAGFNGKYPKPYNWILFTIGILFYIAAQLHLRKKQ
jgi:hypothetical protein